MRQTKDSNWLEVAGVIAKRSTCGRRAVGCVLTNSRGVILSTGYNGPGSGRPNCSPESPCEAMSLQGFERDFRCEAIHAEDNALIFCPDVWSIHTCYVTTAPCLKCFNKLLNSSCRRVVAGEVNERHRSAIELWQAAGGEFIKLEQ